MIEIIYNKEKEKSVGNEEYFCVPRNIRQIGEVPKEYKIYIEDYVYTYLTSDWKENEMKDKMAILLGKCNWKNGISYVFIKSAISVEKITISKDSLPLNDTLWGEVYEDMKTYFPGQEVVGWYLSVPNSGMCITDTIVRTHLKHFGGSDKIFLYADSYEKESCFYVYKSSEMERLDGYYIFYEKNDPMQEYMLVRKPEAAGDYAGKVQDRAVQDFRKIIARKQEERDGKKRGFSSWTVAACTGIVAASLGVSAFWVLRQEDTQSDAEYISAEETSSVMEELLIREEEKEEEEMVLLTPEPVETPEDAEDISPITQVQEIPEQESDMPDASGEETAGEETGEEETSVSVYTKYTVRTGDTIGKISMRYYGDFSKIAEICKINNMLEEDIIYPGQIILLP